MELKTIQTGQFISEFNSDYGMLYKYMYTFTDGTQGTMNHKTNFQKWNNGQEVGVEQNGIHDGVAKVKISKPDAPSYAGVVTPNAPQASAGRDNVQNVIGTQWAINAAIKWIEFKTQDPTIETFNHVAHWSRELIKMRDNLDTYNYDTTQPTDGPF